MITILNDRYQQVCSQMIKNILAAQNQKDKKSEAIERLKLANFRVAYYEQFVPEYSEDQWGYKYYKSQVIDNLWLKQAAVDLCIDADVDVDAEISQFNLADFA